MTFDTWFISSLSPSLAYGELNCPIFDLRFKSHDIIRTWLFYTITMSHFINDQIPWKTIMITGHTLDNNDEKYSKSLGNAIPSKPFISKYGISGIRYWASSNTLGNDTKIDEDKMKMGWRIKNKILNANKFIEMQINNNWIGSNESLIHEYNTYKKSILNKLDNLELDKASDEIYEFFWNIFCSKWIEDSKKSSTSTTLKYILNDFIPIMEIIIGDIKLI